MDTTAHLSDKVREILFNRTLMSLSVSNFRTITFYLPTKLIKKIRGLYLAAFAPVAQYFVIFIVLLRSTGVLLLVYYSACY